MSGHTMNNSQIKSNFALALVYDQKMLQYEHTKYYFIFTLGDPDEDLMCQICLQPFVQPIDTPCGHTFCHVCIHNYLKVNPMCPLDRKPLNEMTCSPSNLVLKR